MTSAWTYPIPLGPVSRIWKIIRIVGKIQRPTLRLRRIAQHGWPALLVFGFGLILASPAQSAGPDDILRRLADELTEAVRADRELQNPYSERMAEFMRKRVVPRFNFEMITRSVVGKNWMKATAQERRALVSQFSQLMIRSYSKAVARLKDFDIEVETVKVVSQNESVTVKTKMIGPPPQFFQIDYDMMYDGSGWRVHDITFEGISLVNSYREEFSSLIADNGIDGLIAELEMKNGK